MKAVVVAVAAAVEPPKHWRWRRWCPSLFQQTRPPAATPDHSLSGQTDQPWGSAALAVAGLGPTIAEKHKMVKKQ